MAVKENKSTQKNYDDEDQVIIFKLHDEFFGFDILLITEIIEVVTMNFVPRAPDIVAGAINHHGKIVTIVNLASVFHLPSTEISLHSKIIVIVKNSFSVGFLVDGIKEITSLSQAPEEGRPVVDAETNNQYIENIFLLNNTLCKLVDIESLLPGLKEYFEGITVEH